MSPKLLEIIEKKMDEETIKIHQIKSEELNAYIKNVLRKIIGDEVRLEIGTATKNDNMLYVILYDEDKCYYITSYSYIFTLCPNGHLCEYEYGHGGFKNIYSFKFFLELADSNSKKENCRDCEHKRRKQLEQSKLEQSKKDLKILKSEPWIIRWLNRNKN